MAAIPGWLLRQTIDVEPYRGDTGTGPTYGEATAVRCHLDDDRRLLRDEAGKRVQGQAVAYCALGADIPPESRVTAPDGRRLTAVQVTRNTGGGLPTPDHLEIVLA